MLVVLSCGCNAFVSVVFARVVRGGRRHHGRCRWQPTPTSACSAQKNLLRQTQPVASLQFIWHDHRTCGGGKLPVGRPNFERRSHSMRLADAERQSYFVAEAAAVQVPFVLLALALFLVGRVVGVIKLPKILGHPRRRGEQDELRPSVPKPKVAFRGLGHFRVRRGRGGLGLVHGRLRLSLDILEDIQSSGSSGAMAGIAFIKGIDVSVLGHEGVLGLADVLLGGAMLGRFAGSGLMGWVSPSRLLAAAGLCAVG